MVLTSGWFSLLRAWLRATGWCEACAADQAQTGKFWGGAGPAGVHNLATLAQTMGDFDRAGSCYDESIADFAEVNDLAGFARATITCRSGYAGGCRR